MKLLLILPVAAIFLALSLSSVRAHSTISIVDITDDGFEPREIEIDSSSTVRFINKTRVDRWPASNPHPVHTGYADFDPKKPIPAGASWDFLPQKVGTWKYHDHLFPHQRGTLVVAGETDEENNQQTAVDEHSSLAYDLFAKLTNLLRESLDRLGINLLRNSLPDEALAKVGEQQIFVNERTMNIDAFKKLDEQGQYQQLKEMSENQGLEKTWAFVKIYPNEGHAHDLAHYTGSLIYQQRGIKGLSICDTMFAFGCFHGFTEAAFTNNLDQLSDVVSACESLGRKGSGPWASCIHGIGHGVVTYVDVNDLNKALSVCDSLESGQQYCWDGVFMEFTISAPRQFFEYGSLNGKVTNPLTSCLSLDKAYRSSCGRAIPKLLENRLQLRNVDIAETCSSGPDRTLADSCIDAIGLEVGQESTGHTEAVWQGCTGMPSKETYAHCVTAAAGEFVFQNFPGWEVATYHLCDALDQSSSQACFERVRQLAADYSRM